MCVGLTGCALRNVSDSEWGGMGGGRCGGGEVAPAGVQVSKSFLTGLLVSKAQSDEDRHCVLRNERGRREREGRERGGDGNKKCVSATSHAQFLSRQ